MESFAELLAESEVEKRMRPGAILTGTVVDVGTEYVTVHAGLKSESIIPLDQFRGESGAIEVMIGDSVEVALDTVEDGFGATRLSREKAKRARAWARLESSFEEAVTVTGFINGKVKGGFTVDIDDIRAFLPGSLVDVRPVRDTSYLEGKPLEFKVIKLDRRRNNVVVSRRAVVEEENSAEREALLQSLQEGAVLQGVVKNLTEYGAFVDLGGIDGLLHITDMAWKRVRHPTEVVNVGDELQVKVLKFDRERNRVSLGLKQLGADPWVDIERRYPESTRLFGLVTNIADYGCFVEIEEGVEGLVHVSEMDWTNKNVHPSRVVALNDEVEVMVLDIDQERRRISLGIKQCQPNPWEDFAANHNKGDRRDRQDQVHHGLRSVRGPGGFHRRTRAPLRHLLAAGGGGSDSELQEGRRDRNGGAGGGRGTRAHIARYQAARQGSLLCLPRSQPQGQRGAGHGSGSRCEGRRGGAPGRSRRTHPCLRAGPGQGGRRPHGAQAG